MTTIVGGPKHIRDQMKDFSGDKLKYVFYQPSWPEYHRWEYNPDTDTYENYTLRTSEPVLVWCPKDGFYRTRDITTYEKEPAP